MPQEQGVNPVPLRNQTLKRFRRAPSRDIPPLSHTQQRAEEITHPTCVPLIAGHRRLAAVDPCKPPLPMDKSRFRVTLDTASAATKFCFKVETDVICDSAAQRCCERAPASPLKFSKFIITSSSE